MNQKRLNPNVQDFYTISSLINHYNPLNYKKPQQTSDFEIPEPETCPKPHLPISASNSNFLSVPISNTADNSFRSLSSRADFTKRSLDNGKKSGELTKRSVDLSKRSNSPYASPRTVAQDVERILMIEQQIKNEKERYKKLEKKYKELMKNQNINQNRFESIVQELQIKIQEKKGNVTVKSVFTDIATIKEKIKNIEKKLDTTIECLSINN